MTAVEAEQNAGVEDVRRRDFINIAAVSFAGVGAAAIALPLNLTLLKGCDIVGVFWGTWVNKDLEGYKQSVAELLDFYKAGKIKPHVSATFPLARAGEAITHLAERRALGKVVVTL